LKPNAPFAVAQQYIHHVEVSIRDGYIQVPIIIEIRRRNRNCRHPAEVSMRLKGSVTLV